MLENEDSVVTSLNELRKLKHERITRQTQTRAVVGSGRAAALAVDPASEQMTPPPVSVSSLSHAQPASFGSLAPQASAAPFGNFAAQPAGYAAPVIQTKTSYKAAVVMTLLLGGVGAAGYMKFDGETRALRTAKENAVKDAEQARMQSAEMVAKAEVQARNNLRQCEDKLKAAAAVVPAAPAVVSPSAPAVVEKKPEKPAAAPKVAARATGHKVAAARPSRRAAAEPAAAKKEKDDVPNIAKKKKLDNDPLAGLGKL